MKPFDKKRGNVLKQSNHWLKYIVNCIQAERALYITVLASFLAGGILAAVFVFTMSELSCEELLLYMNDFFHNMSVQGADAKAVFFTGLRQNLQNVCLLFMLSVMVIGAPFVAGFASVQGFMHCFTLFFMFRLYGAKAVLFLVAGMLPHYLLLAPCYLALCVACLSFSLSLTKEKLLFTRKLPLFSGKLLVFYAITVLSVLMQSYVEPVLIRLIAGLF